MADNNNGGINPVAAGLVGVVVGAAAVVMADKKNRDKVMKKAHELKKQG